MIDINVSFLFQLGLFWLVMIVLNTMFFKPMLKYLDYRKSLIEGRKGDVQKISRDVEDQEKYYLEKVRETKEKGIDFKKALREEIVREQKQKLDEEQKTLEDTIKKSKNELLGEAEKVKKDIDVIAGGLGRFMAEKVLGRQI